MINRWLVIGLILALALVGYSVWPDLSPSLENLQPGTSVDASGYAHGRVAFENQSVTVLIPTTQHLQQRGLAGRTALSDSEGMLWQYASSVRPTFWMGGMLIPLDFIWLKQSRIAEITPNIPPPSSADDAPAVVKPEVYVDAVLEVPAGFAERHGLRVGDVVEISRN